MGKPFSDLTELDQWKRYNDARSRARAPGGEFMLNVQARAWECMERIRDRHGHLPDATVAVVSHGDVIRGLLLLLLGMPIDHIHRLEIAPTSVSEFAFGEGDPTVRFINREFD
jgi:probable phosphoglycerate mutase